MDELLTEADEEYNKKVEILKRHKDLLMGDLFGELTFIVITAKQNSEKLIGLYSAKDNWSKCFTRENLLNLFIRLKENERYTDCLNRYWEEGHCGGGEKILKGG